MNAEAVKRVNVQLKTLNLRKLGNFKKIFEMLVFDDEYLAGHPKGQF